MERQAVEVWKWYKDKPDWNTIMILVMFKLKDLIHSYACVHKDKSLTCQTMPLVDSKEAVGSDGDDGSWWQTWLGVGCYMCYRRIWRKLQHHDNVLLHLLRKHQWGLQEKILFKSTGWTTRMQGREKRTERSRKMRVAASGGKRQNRGTRKETEGQRES